MCDVCMCCIAFSFDIGRITLCPDAACFAARVQLLLVVLRHQNSGRICRLPVFPCKDEVAFMFSAWRLLTSLVFLSLGGQH